MTGDRKWQGATGVVPPGHTGMTLPDDAWEHVQNIVQQRLGRLPPLELRKALDDALQVRQAASYLQQQGTPKKIRYNLKRASEAASRLNDRLNDLDGNSRQLLADVPDGSISQLYHLVSTVVLALAQAERLAGDFPNVRQGIGDGPSLNMARYLALGIKGHLGQDVTSTNSGLFAQLYAVLADLVGISSDSRAIRRAIKFIRKCEQEDAESPL